FLAGLAPMERTGGEEARRARFARRVAPSFADPARALDLAPVETSEEAAAAVARSLRAFELGARLGEPRSIPSLVIQGALARVPAGAACETADLLGARRVVLEGAGHAPFVEAEEPFLAAVTTFLDERP